LSFGQKIALISQLKNELTSFPAFSYRKIKDLIKMCSDSNPDVVIKSTNAICDIFEDILPSYRIRENHEESKTKISKEVEQLRD
jgi:hypothetical protein